MNRNRYSRPAAADGGDGAEPALTMLEGMQVEFDEKVGLSPVTLVKTAIPPREARHAGSLGLGRRRRVRR